MKLKQKRSKLKLTDQSESEDKTSGSEYEPTDKSISDIESSLSSDHESDRDTSTRKRKLCNKSADLKNAQPSTSKRRKLSDSNQAVADTSSQKQKQCVLPTDSNHKAADKSNNKKKKPCNTQSESELSSDDDLDVGKSTKHTLESSTANSSLDLSINLASVGSVLKNKRNEILKTSKDGVKKNVCVYCIEDRIKTKNPNKKVHFSKLADHYEIAHANEQEIKELKSIPKTKLVKGLAKTDNQKKRAAILEELRNKGNHLNNQITDDVSEYVVSRRPQFTFVSACTLMTQFSELCNAKNPVTLRGTLFRKQLATTGMEKGINDQEVEKLANFMGHTPRIHIQNYRQSIIERDVAMSHLVKEAQTSKKTKTPKNVYVSEQDESLQPTQSIEPDQSEGIDESIHQNFDESIEKDQDTVENDQNTSNCSISSVKTNKKLRWKTAAINAVMAYFPNALDLEHEVPSASQINAFLKTVQKNPDFKSRKEPQIRSWFHVQRNKTKTDAYVPLKNNVPNYIYGKFEKYITAKEVPSLKVCAKFLAQSPSKSHLSIKNIQDWVQQAIKRKSI